MKQLINIPQELRKLNRWVCWNIEERKNKPTKVPKNPKTGGNAMANNSDTWGSFRLVVERCKKDKFLGVGFMFNGDGLLGVDIDNCRNADTGDLTDEAKDIIDTLGSYTEISASGKGVHIICKGKLPEGKRRCGNVEMYETLRFFIMTGDVLIDKGIEERTEQLSIVHKKYVNKAKKEKRLSKEVSKVSDFANTQYLSDDDIIERALKSKNGDLFNDLMNGSWGNRYDSQSEADIALCNILAFWTGKDSNEIDRIFRRSGLFRDKWNERRPQGTYGSMTIDEAIAKCEGVYTPQDFTYSNHSEVINSYEEPEDDGFDYLLKQSDKEVKKDFSLDDIGNAERLVDKFGKELRYCFKFKEWFIWKGNCWKADSKGEIFEIGRQTARAIIKESFTAPDERRDAILKHARKSCNTQAMDSMIKQARSIPGIPIVPTELDINNWLLGTENGVIDLKTGKLGEHKSEYLITKITPIAFDELAKAPTWEAFLNKIFDNNKELINFIQRAVGYSMTGETTEQCFFMCHGSGSNGKSTLFNVISDLLGDYSKTADMEIFTERRNGNNTTNEIAMLQGSRLVTTVETNDGVRLNEALVKKLTGSDPIIAKKLYNDPFEYIPVFKIWMAVNHLPMIKGTDYGIWRRIRLIPFNVKITETEKDAKLPEKLKAEYSGILNWALEGCKQWQKQGLNPPDVVLMATNEYKQDQDLFGDFISACCVIGSDIKADGRHLYKEYEAYCEESNYHPLSNKRFVSAMRERGFTKEATRSRRYNWLGIGVAMTDELEKVFHKTFWERS